LPYPVGRTIKQSWPSKTNFCSASFCFGVVLNRSFPLDRRTSIKYYRNPSLFQENTQRLIQTRAVTAKSVYRALLPVRMLEIELYHISLSPSRGRSGFEISLTVLVPRVVCTKSHSFFNKDCCYNKYSQKSIMITSTARITVSHACQSSPAEKSTGFLIEHFD